jgi:hypothetical protein
MFFETNCIDYAAQQSEATCSGKREWQPSESLHSQYNLFGSGCGGIRHAVHYRLLTVSKQKDVTVAHAGKDWGNLVGNL